MSNSTSGFLGAEDLGGFGYGVGVSIGILLLITTITLASYYCTRTAVDSSAMGRRNGENRRQLQPDLAGAPAAVVVDLQGLEEATIKSYPKLLYSEAQKLKIGLDNSTANSCCSICLADYKGSDGLRMIPDCGHLFHHKCIDPWLRMHPTCPVCRTSPMPTPMSTPLAEVVPLASRRD